MPGILRGRFQQASRIDGHESPGEAESSPTCAAVAAKSVRITRINGHRIHFRELAIMAFPQKTEANLSFLAQVDARTARRWLADDTEPPAHILGIILAEIMRRFHQR